MRHQRRLIPSTSALIALEAVARTGGFTLAAHELSLSQSAISRQVQALEAQLDCTLVERSSRKLELTEAGRVYVKDIRQALDLIRNATIELISKRQKQVLNIAILPTFGTRWLMPRISAFVEKHPQITLNFATRIGRFDFAAANLDIAIYHGLPDWPNVRCTLLMQETVVPVVSRTLVAENEITSARDLLRFQRLSMRSRPGAWRNWFNSQGIAASKESGMSFEHFSTLAQACIAGMGVALVPEFLIKPELARQDLVQVGQGVMSESAYYVAQPRQSSANKAADLFKYWLLDEAGKPA